jgi:hypothetical protein
MQGWRARLISGLLLILLAAGCSETFTPPLDSPSPPPPSPSPLVLVTAAPLLPTAGLAVITPTPNLLPPAPTLAPSATPMPITPIQPSYKLVADVNARAHTVVVTATVGLTVPETRDLVFNINALQERGLFQLRELRVNNAAANFYAVGVWLYVPLPAVVRPADRLEVTFAYALTLPHIAPEAEGWHGSLGWTPRQINLGDWYPTLALYAPGQGWVTHSPSVLGEYQMAEAADFDVTLRATGFAAEPLILGSGQPGDCAPAHCFTLSGGRFVAYMLSDQMESRSITTAGGITVTSAYFWGHYLPGRAALEVAATALENYSQRFGAYPYPTFALVEGDFYDGMEYSGLSFVGESYYSGYDTTANNWLTAITAHETAHQWWYSLVANDQALEPWLDEALCTYSEVLYLEAAHPKVVANWWHWRIDTRKPAGPVNGSVYAFDAFRPYVNAVYLRGAEMLQTMRQAVGDERFFAFLRAYTQAKAGRVAHAADFWQAYTDVGGDAAAIQAIYFREP